MDASLFSAFLSDRAVEAEGKAVVSAGHGEIAIDGGSLLTAVYDIAGRPTVFVTEAHVLLNGFSFKQTKQARQCRDYYFRTSVDAFDLLHTR